jgi:hypothetical protein
MPDSRDAASVIEALLAEQRAIKAAAEADIAALERALALAQGRSSPIKSAESPETQASIHAKSAESPPILSSEPRKGRFWGLAKPDALVKLLGDTGAPLSLREMSAILDAEGFPSTHEDPVKSVGWALKKRAEKVGDVLLIGSGKWGLCKWYTEDELDGLKRRLGGMGGRDRGEHSAKTRAGMAALRANGVLLGRRPGMTPERLDTIEQMILAQRKVADIAAEFGVSKASIYGYFTVKRVGGKQTAERRNTAPVAPLRLVK